MSDAVTQDPSGATDQGVGDADQSDASAAGGSEADQQQQQQAQDTVQAATYRKLLGQKKRQDQELATLQSRIDEMEQAKMQTDGQKDELIEKLKTKLRDKEEEVKKQGASYAYKSVTAQISAEAARMGCVDPDALIRLADIDELEVDENFNVDSDEMKRVLENLRKTKPYLFDKPSPRVADGKPVVETGKKPLGKMSLKDLGKEIAKTI